MGYWDADGQEEGMSTSVVAGVDAPPVLHPAEHDLDLVALTVEHRVVRDGDFAVGLGRDAGVDSTLGQGVSEAVAVITFVGDQLLGCR